MKLSELREGEVGIIEKINVSGSALRRLNGVGFSEGAAVKCFKVRGNAARGVIAYVIKGAVFAMRRETAEKIICSSQKR